MPRKPQLRIPGALYHANWRGNKQRDIIFGEEDLYRVYRLLGVVAGPVRVAGGSDQGGHTSRRGAGARTTLQVT